MTPRLFCPSIRLLCAAITVLPAFAQAPRTEVTGSAVVRTPAAQALVSYLDGYIPMRVDRSREWMPYQNDVLIKYVAWREPMEVTIDEKAVVISARLLIIGEAALNTSWGALRVASCGRSAAPLAIDIALRVRLTGADGTETSVERVRSQPCRTFGKDVSDYIERALRTELEDLAAKIDGIR